VVIEFTGKTYAGENPKILYMLDHLMDVLMQRYIILADIGGKVSGIK